MQARTGLPIKAPPTYLSQAREAGCPIPRAVHQFLPPLDETTGGSASAAPTGQYAPSPRAFEDFHTPTGQSAPTDASWAVVSEQAPSAGVPPWLDLTVESLTMPSPGGQSQDPHADATEGGPAAEAESVASAPAEGIPAARERDLTPSRANKMRP